VGIQAEIANGRSERSTLQPRRKVLKVLLFGSSFCWINAASVHFCGLKGRFCQPRLKAWVSRPQVFFGPEGAVHSPDAEGNVIMPQSLAKVYIHLVFSTKSRIPVLADTWRDELFQVLGGSANNLGCQSLIVGGVADHIHMLFQLARTISLSDAIGTIKWTSSAWINQTRSLSTPFQWQGGYAAFSVSQSNVEAVRDYIRRQPEHHQRQSFQDELREWLRRYEVDWDERYLWD
jgi:putative transposase